MTGSPGSGNSEPQAQIALQRIEISSHIGQMVYKTSSLLEFRRILGFRLGLRGSKSLRAKQQTAVSPPVHCLCALIKKYETNAHWVLAAVFMFRRDNVLALDMVPAALVGTTKGNALAKVNRITLF